MEVLHRKLVSDADIGLASVYNCTSTICDEYCASCVYDSSPPAPSPVADESAHNNHAVPYLVSAACVLGIAFLILTTCTIILRHRWSRRRSSRSVVATSQDSEEDFDPVDHPIWHIVTVGLPQSVIDSITAVSYKTCDGFIDGSDCSVCLTQFEDGDEVRVLPKCSHAFHLPCIDTWLRSHKNCPLCRAPVVNDSSPVTLNRNSSNPDSSRSDGIQNPENPREIAHGDNDDDFYALPVEAAGTAERVLSYVGENLRVDRESFEPVRSVSLDSPAASAVNKSVMIDVGILNSGEGSSEQEKIVEVEEAEKEGNQDSGISRLMKSSSIGLSLQMSPVARILSPFRGSKSQSSSTLP